MMDHKYYIYLILFALINCNNGPDPSKPPFTISIPKEGYENYYNSLLNISEDINNRINCNAINITKYNSNLNIKFLVWQSNWNTNIGVAWITSDTGNDWDFFWTGQYQSQTLNIVIDNLPPEESITGKLSPCEVNYLFVWWIAQLIGWSVNSNAFIPQYTDTSKITYSHPNCPGYIADIVGELIKELNDNNINLCKEIK